MKDEIVGVRVARGTEEFGAFFLSFVELLLKEGRFQPDDWGWIIGITDWEPLGDVVRIARNNSGKKKLATTAQRSALRRCDFEPWEGISNREASAILNHISLARKAPPGFWVEHPVPEYQIQRIKELGIGFISPSATPKQVAYLTYMGVRGAHKLTLDEASATIEGLFNSTDRNHISSLEEKRRAWEIERYILHPDLYAREIQRHRESILEEQAEILHAFVRSKLKEGSEKLTKFKIKMTIEKLQDECADWWALDNNKYIFFRKLEELFPSCVDGDKKETPDKK